MVTGFQAERSPVVATTAPPPVRRRANDPAAASVKRIRGTGPVRRAGGPGTSSPPGRYFGPGGRSGGPGRARTRPGATMGRPPATSPPLLATPGGVASAQRRPAGQAEQLPERVEGIVEVAHGQGGPAWWWPSPSSWPAGWPVPAGAVAGTGRGRRRASGQQAGEQGQDARRGHQTGARRSASAAACRRRRCPPPAGRRFTSGRRAGPGRPAGPRTRTPPPRCPSPGSESRISRI